MSSPGSSISIAVPSSSERLKWAVAGCGLSALGLESPEPLHAPSEVLSTRLEELESGACRRRLRFPLPGTPDLRGRFLEAPGPLGTGWLWLTVFRGAWRELMRARWTHPRSLSLAEREWNLICHLRAHGVGAPEPVLVGARGGGLVSTRSFLLLRAPEDAFPLPRWIRSDGLGAERTRGAEAIGRTLALLRRSGLRLPGLRAEHLWMTPSGSGECETQVEGEPRKNKLPGVTLVEVRGGWIGKKPTGADVVEPLLRELDGFFEGEDSVRIRTLVHEA